MGTEGHDCTTARLHDCTTARLHDCTTARLHDCTTARLHNCPHKLTYAPASSYLPCQQGHIASRGKRVRHQAQSVHADVGRLQTEAQHLQASRGPGQLHFCSAPHLLRDAPVRAMHAAGAVRDEQAMHAPGAAGRVSHLRFTLMPVPPSISSPVLLPRFDVHVHIHVYEHVHWDAYACLCPSCGPCPYPCL